ncbi:hypothetical protein GIS00_13270 [Nakamurella sp. YIM 132087]|uniref:SGNH hydrolase-type esterase domain-containing protein n=1 Tax=Nakamurella alba TaxID=2665158 RepID=A0A7K1FLH0_9ACTN|nr:GDSL-type esterase/lipase family protein [Nakamurella alba]MTD14910.1 hypothetical protein [Nakamurella alba]
MLAALALVVVAVLLLALLLPTTGITGRPTVAGGGGSDGSTPVSTSVPTTTPEPPPVPTRLTVTGGTAIAHLDDPVELIARVWADDGRAVPNARVALRIAGTNPGAVVHCVPATCLTGADGVVAVRYTGTAIGVDAMTVTVAGTALSFAQDVQWRESVRGAAVAALGDSYSAGEGAGDYEAGTDGEGGRCHRSAHAYGPLLVPSGLAFRACSGAVTGDLLGAGNAPAQLCSADCPDDVPAAVGPDTGAVMLTVGGNDAGFTQVLTSCIWISEFNLNYGRPGRGCRNQQDLASAVDARLAALGGGPSANGAGGRPIVSFDEILDRIHTLAPDAQVYLVGYPRLFEPGSGDCGLGRITVTYSGRSIAVATKITPDDARWLDGKADELNALQRTAAEKAGSWVHVVDTAAAFAGHGLCSGDPWINGTIGSLTIKGTDNIDVAVDPASFHPTLTGQQGIADAVRAAGFTR